MRSQEDDVNNFEEAKKRFSLHYHLVLASITGGDDSLSRMGMKIDDCDEAIRNLERKIQELGFTIKRSYGIDRTHSLPDGRMRVCFFSRLVPIAQTSRKRMPEYLFHLPLRPRQIESLLANLEIKEVVPPFEELELLDEAKNKEFVQSLGLTEETP